MALSKPSLKAFPQAPETGSLIRDFPDGFSQLPTMVAQWASDPNPALNWPIGRGPRFVGHCVQLKRLEKSEFGQECALRAPSSDVG